MQLTHSFTVPARIEQAWEVLLDIERIAPCMPGAALETVDGDDFTGSVKVRLGPIGLTYKGKASFVTKDAANHRAVIDAQGKDARGNGTAKATITATLTGEGSGTAVNVVTDLNITGKPAQFGRGVMVDVGNRLIQQFADCLAGKLAEAGPGGGGTESADGIGAGASSADLQEQVAGVGAVDPDTVRRLASADLVDAEQLGTADSEGSGPAAGPGTAEPALVEAGLAGLGQPSVTPESAVAGPGLASTASTDRTAGSPAVEPAAASEQAPSGQRVDDAGGAASGSLLGQGFAPAQDRQPSRPAASEVEPIDLLGSAGPALAKRLAPVAAAIVLVVLLLVRRRRH
ncbi:MAG: hypothetical protein QOE23_315 [Pseudonocardiales bacterium]|jgi:carbon monoxide dehydrogenase subunit G|nr:hypothetical protein [Pseudonocardiales bacterium]